MENTRMDFSLASVPSNPHFNLSDVVSPIPVRRGTFHSFLSLDERPQHYSHTAVSADSFLLGILISIQSFLRRLEAVLQNIKRKPLQSRHRMAAEMGIVAVFQIQRSGNVRRYFNIDEYFIFGLL